MEFCNHRRLHAYQPSVSASEEVARFTIAAWSRMECYTRNESWSKVPRLKISDTALIRSANFKIPIETKQPPLPPPPPTLQTIFVGTAITMLIVLAHPVPKPLISQVAAEVSSMAYALPSQLA